MAPLSFSNEMPVTLSHRSRGLRSPLSVVGACIEMVHGCEPQSSSLCHQVSKSSLDTNELSGCSDCPFGPGTGWAESRGWGAPREPRVPKRRGSYWGSESRGDGLGENPCFQKKKKSLFSRLASLWNGQCDLASILLASPQPRVTLGVPTPAPVPGGWQRNLVTCDSWPERYLGRLMERLIG